MSRFPYKFFENFIVRSPLLSNKEFQQKSEGEFSDIELQNICSDPVFQEAIYLASPYLFEELQEWLSGKKFHKKELQKLKQSVLKYYIRMSTRCTPFGLFSGVGIGRFEHPALIDPKINFSDLKFRDTKLDMHFLTALSESITKKSHILDRLSFYPNNSIYKVGDRIRYVEYEIDGDRRNYIISTAKLSDELQKIISFSEKGKTIDQLAEILINKEITKEEAVEFIKELITNKVLISQLEPNVSGVDFLEEMIRVLKLLDAKDEVETLVLIQNKIQNLDEQLGNLPAKYVEIEEIIKGFEMRYEKKYLFQTDLYFHNEYKVSTNWIKELKNGMGLLNKISLNNKETHFSKFKKAFRERFDNEEVPLSYVLDSEVGIGYRQDIVAKGIHPYLEDLDIKKNHEKEGLNVLLNHVQMIFNQKVQEALQERAYIISLSDEDFKDFEVNWDNLPDTISFIGEFISEENTEKVFLGGISGNGAADLMGRFCSEKSQVRNIVTTICDMEEELNNDIVLAEIIHLPDARIGNVIRRPTVRNYEIPYLAKSILPKENQISVSDLYISLKNDRIKLYSKKLNKEVMPRLTNAHNYYSNSLPIYHFLCDLHSQDIRSGLSFDWGGLNLLYMFLPRVEYKNIILSKARWRIMITDILFLDGELDNEGTLMAQIRIWRNKKQIPKWVQWVKSDNTLTLNLENYQMVNLFIEIIKKEKSIFIEEFLWNENYDFQQQIIFPLYKEK